MEKYITQRYLLFFGACFFAGLTFGSIMGLGGEAVHELSVQTTPLKRMLFSFLSDLPFWCCVFLPAKEPYRMLAMSGGLCTKGLLIGFSSVCLMRLSEAELYLQNIFPQLISVVPMLLSASALKIQDKRSGSKGGIEVLFFISVASALLSALVRYGFFFIISLLYMN